MNQSIGIIKQISLLINIIAKNEIKCKRLVETEEIIDEFLLCLREKYNVIALIIPKNENRINTKYIPISKAKSIDSAPGGEV